jgi:hypothetical protein
MTPELPPYAWLWEGPSTWRITCTIHQWIRMVGPELIEFDRALSRGAVWLEVTDAAHVV